MNKKIKIIIFLIIVALVVYFLYQHRFKDVSKDALKNVEKTVEKTEEVIPNNDTDSDMKREIAELKKINPEVIGIIDIKGLDIRYPVLQTDNNEYYLERDINKDMNINGSIFADYKSNPPMDSDNLILYGHNMRHGSMFAKLNNLKDPDTFNNVREIVFYGPDITRKYEILFTSVVDVSVSDFYPYHTFTNAREDYSKEDYIKDFSNLSLNSRMEEGLNFDHIITLSTCSYETSDARYVVVGVEKI